MSGATSSLKKERSLTMDYSSPGIPSNRRAAGKLSKIIDVHSHAILKKRFS